MTKPFFIRNICIGLIDGIIIPLAIASGISGFVSSQTVVLTCLAAAAAGAITMSIGGFYEAKKYEPSLPPASSSVTIGCSYFCGGLIVSLPYFFMNDAPTAYPWSAAISFIALLIAGYTETSLHGGKGWRGALRVVITGALAAAAGYFVSRLFW